MDGANVEMAGLPVLAQTLRTANGRLIGVLTLDAERTLNALSLPMIDLLARHLDAWDEDERVAMVLLQGAGGKAFCAGGDLHQLYRTMRAQRDSDQAGDVRGNPYANAFFGREYRLDYRIHTYRKPVLCWGHGIVMGGGIGLMAGASHRVATERTRLAMPEAGIGLFPDVGGSWFLNRMPGHAGRFLALTGASFDAADALHLGLADVALPHACKDEVVAALLKQPWSGDAVASHALLGFVLRQARARAGDVAWMQMGQISGQISGQVAGQVADQAAGPVGRHRDLIDRLCGGDSVEDALAGLAALAEADSGDPWLRKAAAATLRASPGALRLAWRMQDAARGMPLAGVFRLEYGVALHCAARGDFAEGIRALLVDKDMAPRWLPPGSTATFLDDPWAPGLTDEPHPLAGLGAAPAP